ncbi:enolase [Patescibacteria group bacterium]|nr:enolase [Patescibacteria group bacterium]
MSVIKNIVAKEILDARGLPTLECTLWLDDGRSVTTSVPSGTSTGKYEAKELRDNDAARMMGKGVLKAVENVNNILAPQLIDKDPTNQTDLDQLMVNLDGTKDKSKLGANAILVCSQAILKAGALASNLPLYIYIQQKYQLTQKLLIPTCIFSMIEGGKHGAENLDIQEFEIIPASHVDYPSAINMAVTIYQKIKEVLMMKGAIHSTGLNGGFAPNLFNNTDAFEIIIESIKATPYTFAQDVFLGADMSAATFHEAGKYSLKDKSQALSSKELAKYYKTLKDLYHVFYIEDPFQEDDESAWKEFTADVNSTGMVVADKLLVTSLERTTRAISEKLCNSITVKPNQTGTVSETIQVIKLAKDSGWQVICSHRSGETNDDFVADLAVGAGVQYVKFGPPNRGERVAKYNRLSSIYDEMGHIASALPPTPELEPITSGETPTTEIATDEAIAKSNSSPEEPLIDPNAPLTELAHPELTPQQPIASPIISDPNVLEGLTTPANIEPMPELSSSIDSVAAPAPINTPISPTSETSEVVTAVAESTTGPVVLNQDGEINL